MGYSDKGGAEQQGFVPGSYELLEAYAKARGASVNNLVWQDIALCKGMDTENFYSMYENSKQHAKAINALCDACPVKALCRSTGEESREHGTWGGVFWNGKGKPDKRYNRD